MMRCKVAQKYSITESSMESILLGLFCPGCSVIQIINEILIKENKTWSCCGVSNSGGAPSIEIAGAPAGEGIVR